MFLGAFLQGLRGQRLVVQACQHQQRHARRRGVAPAYRFQSLCIGQPQVEQDDVDGVLRKVLLGLSHALHVRQFDVARALLPEHPAQQPGVSGVIFDQEKSRDRFPVHQIDLCCGNVAFVGQNSVMDFMRFSHCACALVVLTAQASEGSLPFRHP
jgi:hypothetical protein